MVSKTESAWTRARRPVLGVDSRDGIHAALAQEAIRAGLLPRTLPNSDRVMFHLSGDERFDALLIPEHPRAMPLATFVQQARRLRPEIPIIVAAADATRLPRLQAELRSYGLEDERTCAAAIDVPLGVREALRQLGLGSGKDEVPVGAKRAEAA